MSEPPRDSSPSLRSAYDEFLRHEATKSNSPAPALRRSRTGLLVGLGVGIFLAGIGGVAWWLRPQDPAPMLLDSTGARALMAIALQVEDYRRSTGHLPDSLGVLGLSLPQVTFQVRPDGRFLLRTSTGHHALVYLAGDTEVRSER